MSHRGSPWLLCFVALDCTGSSDGGPLPIEQLGAAYHLAVCRSTLACSPRNRLFHHDVATCAASEAVQLLHNSIGRMPISSLVARVRAGAIHYDPVAALACIDDLNAGCGDLSSGGGVPASCHRAFVGTNPLGGSCVVSAECRGDAWCRTQDDRGPACPGQCAPRLALGDPCRESAECPAAIAADTVVVCKTPTAVPSAERRCVAVHLASPASAGQPCGRSPSAGGEELTPCAEGLSCRDTCQPPIAAGAACPGEFEPCVEGYTCLGSWQQMVCAPITVRRAASEACGLNFSVVSAEHSICDASQGLACADSRCAPVREVTAGQPCDLETVRCAPGLACNLSREVCVVPLPAGELCEHGADCQSEACDASTGRCRALACE